MDENYKSIIVDLPQGSIEFPQVYLNQVYALKKLNLTNDTNEPVTVNLSSTLASQIFFQKENANYTNDETPQSYNSNQLYNEIDRVNSFQFKPKEAKSIYLSFLPFIDDSSSTKHESQAFKIDDKADGEAFHHFFTVGEIKFETITTDNHQFSWLVPFKTNICRSYFSTNCTQKTFNLHDIFDDNEISVHNHSDIDLFWEICCFNPNNEIQKMVSFFAVHNQKNSWSGILSGSSNLKLRISVDQKLTVNSKLSFVIYNKHDPENRYFFDIETRRSDQSYDKEIISATPSMLEFFNCYNNHNYVKDIEIKNESRFSVKLFFAKKKSAIIKIKEKERKESEMNNTIATSGFYKIQNTNYIVDSVLSPTISKSVESSDDFPFLSSYDKENFLCEIFLKPKTKKKLELSFTPTFGSEENGSIRLSVRKEELNIYHKIQSNNSINLNYLNFEQQWRPKTIEIYYSSCTSIIDVIPKTLNFGENEVETHKTKLILIANLSDLKTTAVIELNSKIVKASVQNIEIEPHSSAQVEFTINPKKPNPNYKKTLLIKNLKNPANTEKVLINSKNLDTKKISLHNSFYNVKSIYGNSVIDYANTTLGFLKISNLILENTSQKELSLQLYTSKSDDASLYCINTNKSSEKSRSPKSNEELSTQNSKFYEAKLSERVLETLDPEISTTKAKEKSSNNNSNQKNFVKLKKLDVIHDVSHKSTSYLDLALNKLTPSKPNSSSEEKTADLKDTIKSPTEKAHPHPENAEKSSTEKPSNNEMNEKSLISNMESLEAILSLRKIKNVPFNEENNFVKSVFHAKKELESIIKERHIKEFDIITLKPHECFCFFLVFNPQPELMINVPKNKSKKYNSKIMIKLLDVDRSINTRFSELLQGDLSKIVPYEIPIKANIYHSDLCILQKSLNYGHISKDKIHENFIALRNKTDVPLLYSLHKSGSIASGSITIDSEKYGVLREHAKKYINYSFCPNISGKFEEYIMIKNILNEKDTQTIKVKAFVRKPPSFSVRAVSDYFGPCFVNKVSLKRCEIEITNESKNPKTLDVRVDPADLDFGRCHGELHFFLPPQSESQKILLTEEVLEKIENLEQKLKIAIRKGNKDKSEKIQESLMKLKNGQSEHLANDDNTSAEPENYTHEPHALKMISSFSLKKKSNTSLSINMIPNSKTSIYVWFVPISDKAYEKTMMYKSKEFVSSQIYIFEPKARDSSHLVVFKSYIYYDFAIYKNEILHNTDECFKKDILKNKYDKSNSYLVLKPDFYVNASSPNSLINRSGNFSSLGSIQNISNFLDFPSHLVLGKYEVDKSNEFYIDMRNKHKFPVSFYVLVKAPEKCLIKSKHGEYVNIGPESNYKLCFTLKSSKIGPIEIDISFVQKSTDTKIGTTKIYLYIHCSRYLNFPIFRNDEEQLLDLGYCYVDTFKKYSQVTPLLVENITPHLLSVNCESNLKQQVTVFMDEFGKKGNVIDMLILPKSKTTIWVAIQHGLSVDKLSFDKNVDKQDKNNVKLRDSEPKYKSCRQLIGGLRFSIKIETINSESQKLYQNSIYFTQVLKFSALVGESMLEVDTTVLNILVSSKHKILYGGFSLKNKSDMMPAEFTIESQNNIVNLDRRKGYIGSKSYYKSIFEDDIRINDNGKRTIGFKVPKPKPGLTIDYIHITNINNSRQKLKVEVRVFMDPNKILCKQLDDNYDKENSSGEEHHFYDSSHPLRNLPVIKWEDIRIKTRSDDTLNESKNISMFIDTKENIDKIIEVTNISGSRVELYTKSDILIKTKWISCTEEMQLHKNSEEPCKNSGNDSFEYYGPRVFLNDHEKVSLVVCCPSLFSLPKEDLEKLRTGKKGQLKGVLVITDSSTKTDLKMFEMISNYYPQKL